MKSEETFSSRLSDIVSEEFHDGKHAKTTILQLLGSQLIQLGLEVDVEVLEEGNTISMVSRSLIVILLEDRLLKESNEAPDLQPAEERNGSNSSNTIRDIRELEALRRREVAGEPSHLLDEVSNDGSLGDTAMLHLKSSPAAELSLIGSLCKACEDKK